jgi:hypothetical protein
MVDPKCSFVFKGNSANTLLRAYRKSVPGPDQPADLVIEGDEGWFNISGADFPNPLLHPALFKCDWHFRRVELFSANLTPIIVLPTLNGDGNDDRVSIEQIVPRNTFNRVLRVRFHLPCVIGDGQATIGFKLDLIRTGNGITIPYATSIFGFEIAHTKRTVLSPTDLRFDNLGQVLDGNRPWPPLEEWVNQDSDAGPFLQRVAAGPWSCQVLAPGSGVVPLSSRHLSLKRVMICSTIPSLEVRDSSNLIASDGLQIGSIKAPADKVLTNLVQRSSEGWLTRTAGPELIVKGYCSLIGLWNGLIGRYREALKKVRSPNRLSLIPTFSPCGDSTPDARGCSLSSCFWETAWEIDIGETPLDKKGQPHIPSGNLSLSLESAAPNSSGNIWKVKFPFDGQGIEHPCSISPYASADPNTMSFQLSFPGALDQTLPARIGSLDLIFGGSLPPLPPESVSTFVIQNLRSLAGPDPTSPATPQVPYVTAHLYLPVLKAEPAGQDGLPANEYAPDGYSLGSATDKDFCYESAIEKRFQGSAPLVIALGPKAPVIAKASFWAFVDESSTEHYSQTVSIKLHALPGDAGTSRQKVLVLDSNPFLVAEVDFQGFHQRPGGDTSDIVAIWDMKNPSGAVWELLTAKDPFDLLLPPQSIGEEMPKAKELAVKDTIDADGKLTPLDYRFSPPARITLDGSYTPQNFTEAPWNLRRILGYAGQTDAGAGIVKLQYELLYGLSCAVSPPMLRLAEIFAILGRIPGRLVKRISSSPMYYAYREQWSKYVALYNSRVAVLEPRTPGPNYGQSVGAKGASGSPEVLTLTDGVNCQFRDADLYYGARPSADQDQFDVHKDGLKGGATWGFESALIYHATLKNPNSSSATLTGPYFSAMGGSGFQKASFQNGLTSVYANTAIGRTFFYSVERMGRIAVYHNLARHVIEYERSVLPGAQFKDSQTPFAGRPVLRKMREFIQVLEPRSILSAMKVAYPECGFVNAIEFKTQIIPVDSAWGTNIGTSGWKIPLWDRAASKTAKDVYPRPEIVFDLAGTEGADVECAIADPEKLFFYTYTQDDANADPHQWQLVEGVDFSLACVPIPNPGFKTANIGEIPSYDALIPPGLTAFTLTLEPGHGRIDLVHGRIIQALGATVQSVTIQRPSGVKPDRQLRIEEVTKAIRSDLFSAIRDPLSPPLKPYVDDLKAKIGALQDTLTSHVNDAATKAKDLETSLVVGWVNALKTEVTNTGKSTMGKELAAELAATPLARVATAAATVSDREALKASAHDHIASLFERLKSLPYSVNSLCQFAATCSRALDVAQQELQGIPKKITVAYGAGSATEVRFANAELLKIRADYETTWTQMEGVVNGRVEPWMPGAALVTRTLGSAIAQQFQAIGVVINGAVPNVTAVQAAAQKLVVPQLATAIATLKGYAGKASLIPDALDDARSVIESQADRAIDALQLPLPADPAAELAILTKAMVAQVDPAWIDVALPKLQALDASVSNIANSIAQWLQQFLQDAPAEVIALLNALSNAAGAAANELERYRTQAEDALGRYVDSLLTSLPPISVSLPAGSQAAILLQRAFGDVPRVPNLDFSIPNAAYFFDPALQAINVTPLLSKVSDLGSALSPLSTKLPSLSLLERPIPIPSLSNFDLSSIFPDFAGLKLSNLFPALRMPSGAGDNIRITHGLDKSSRRAWVQADINITTDTAATLFSIGPLALQLPKATFQSKVKLQVNDKGETIRQVTGSISGNWNLMIGGSSLITLRDTSLSFDEQGHIHFNVDPTRVELAAALQFIQSIIQIYSPKDSGFGLFPSLTGIETRLVLPIPNTSVGTTGITNLTFGFQFGLKWAPFKIETGFSLGRAEAPFNISVFILGGAGHVQVTASYVPGSSISCGVEIELAASASLALALGPISGYVAIFLGMSVRFSSGAGGDLRLGVFLQIVGEASVLGIISAYVSLRLDATYANGQFTGRGEFRISIKICWCFTLSISESVSCTIGSSSTTAWNDYPLLGPDTRPISDVPFFLFSAPNVDDYQDFANLYIDMIS